MDNRLLKTNEPFGPLRKTSLFPNDGQIENDKERWDQDNPHPKPTMVWTQW
jgi:hypothetical protein